MYTTITLKKLLDILPLQTANGIRNGDLSTPICLEDIVENLSYTDKNEFANNNLERLMSYRRLQHLAPDNRWIRRREGQGTGF